MGRLLRFCRSRYRISVAEKDAKRALDLLVSRDIPFHDFSRTEDGIAFYLYLPYYRRYERERGALRFADEKRVPTGLCALWLRYRRRIGLPVGAALALFLIVLSSLFVWDITVSGNDRISTREIVDSLAENGVKLGAYIPSLDTENAEKVVLLSVDGLSWISLNRRGTVVAVEVRERAPNDTAVDRSAPSNLIATADGQIEGLEVTGGVAACRRGDVVRQGQLLVSGVIDSRALGYRLVRARGEVTARVSEVFEVSIPYETAKKTETGKKYSQKTLKIFSKSIKLFGKDSILPESCDTIEKERRLYLFGKIKLPIFLSETVFLEYEMRKVTLSREAALRLARAEVKEMRELSLAEAQILTTAEEITENEDGITVRETVECIRNIAKEVKINTD